MKSTRLAEMESETQFSPSICRAQQAAVPCREPTLSCPCSPAWLGTRQRKCLPTKTFQVTKDFSAPSGQRTEEICLEGDFIC